MQEKKEKEEEEKEEAEEPIATRRSRKVFLVSPVILVSGLGGVYACSGGGTR